MEKESTVLCIDGKPINEDYQQALKSRRALGRYKLNEAAKMFAEGTGELEAPMLEKLMNDVRDGVLRVYAPGKNARYTYNARNRVRDFYEEASWKDLNDWLKANEPGINWEFPNPADAPAVTAKAVQVTSTSGDDWEVRAREIADKIALKKWDAGIGEITARNTCDAVAIELAKDVKNHGNRGSRSSGSIRSVALKGWKFIPPAGTNGTSGTNE